jgi:hypothetical protein
MDSVYYTNTVLDTAHCLSYICVQDVSEVFCWQLPSSDAYYYTDIFCIVIDSGQDRISDLSNTKASVLTTRPANMTVT